LKTEFEKELTELRNNLKYYDKATAVKIEGFDNLKKEF